MLDRADVEAGVKNNKEHRVVGPQLDTRVKRPAHEAGFENSEQHVSKIRVDGIRDADEDTDMSMLVPVEMRFHAEINMPCTNFEKKYGLCKGVVLDLRGVNSLGEAWDGSDVDVRNRFVRSLETASPLWS